MSRLSCPSLDEKNAPDTARINKKKYMTLPRHSLRGQLGGSTMRLTKFLCLFPKGREFFTMSSQGRREDPCRPLSKCWVEASPAECRC
jgi:hypothetical protein